VEGFASLQRALPVFHLALRDPAESLPQYPPGNHLRLASTPDARDQDGACNLPDHAALPDKAVELCEQAVLVRQCVQALPAKHQQVIYLRFYVDDSLEGIAAALGCSVGTVKSRLFHALTSCGK